MVHELAIPQRGSVPTSILPQATTPAARQLTSTVSDYGNAWVAAVAVDNALQRVRWVATRDPGFRGVCFFWVQYDRYCVLPDAPLPILQLVLLLHTLPP
jgi:hypothetical protein